MTTARMLPDADLERCGVSRESRERLAIFVDLLLRWQARINLISPSTIPAVWNRHVLDSLQLVPLVPTSLTAFADLGTGGGFPALPLAIATGAHAHLFESNGKKAAFLLEALRVTGCAGNVHQIRLEALSKQKLPKVELVTARALAPLTELLSLAEPFLASGAQGLFHKGQDIDAELTESQKSWRIKVRKHPSLTDPQAVILQVEEAVHV